VVCHELRYIFNELTLHMMLFFKKFNALFKVLLLLLSFNNLDFVFNVLPRCCFPRTEMSFSMCCCGVIIQEFRYRFQGVAIVLFFKNLDVLSNVLLWCCLSIT
jgi:hypothetical protein